MPFFSVIIPVYNRYEQVKRAVDSVILQEFTDYEIIVVDDGSCDNTGLIADEYSGRIRYVKQQNLGVSSARNRGIGLSQSPYIAFLDSDDEWHPAKLSEHKNFIESNPGSGIHQCEDIWVRNGRVVNPGIKHIKRDGDIFTDSLGLCLISPSSVVISRRIFETYGLFDEKMRVCEDYDLWLRVTPFEHIGLIRKKLIRRYSGHEGQLSASYWGMDRFRVYSMLKLLENSGNRLLPGQKKAAEDCAVKKLAILKNGASKRGNSELSELADRLITKLKDESCMQKDYLILLQI